MSFTHGQSVAAVEIEIVCAHRTLCRKHGAIVLGVEDTDRAVAAAVLIDATLVGGRLVSGYALPEGAMLVMHADVIRHFCFTRSPIGHVNGGADLQEAIAVGHVAFFCAGVANTFMRELAYAGTANRDVAE